MTRIDKFDAPDLQGSMTDAQWAEELEKRVDDAATGREPGRPWEEVKADLLKKLKGYS